MRWRWKKVGRVRRWSEVRQGGEFGLSGLPVISEYEENQCCDWKQTAQEQGRGQRIKGRCQSKLNYVHCTISAKGFGRNGMYTWSNATPRRSLLPFARWRFQRKCVYEVRVDARP